MCHQTKKTNQISVLNKSQRVDEFINKTINLSFLFETEIIRYEPQFLLAQ